MIKTKSQVGRVMYRSHVMDGGTVHMIRIEIWYMTGVFILKFY